MKFKIDENLPTELAEMLNDAGHDASTVYLQKLDGEPDNVISEVCQMEERAIVTLDVGFSNIQTYPPAEFSGIIVLRLARQDKLHVIDVFKRVISTLAEEDLTWKLWIVDEHRIRIRE